MVMNVTEVLVDGEADVVKGKLIKTFPQIEDEYKITFDFYHSGVTGGAWLNLLRFTTQDIDHYVDGHCIPCVWVLNNRIQIRSSVNGNANYSQYVDFVGNVWHSVVISQEVVGNDHVYSVVLDGVSIDRVVNTQPKAYDNVKVYVSGPWYNSCLGKIRNLHFWAKVDPDLQCPCCLKLFQEPTLLECGDSFCSNCIEKLLEDANVVACPVCQLQTPVKEATALWKNEVIQRKLDNVGWKKGFNTKCGECEKSIATKYCLDCKSTFCNECAAHHLKCARTQDHKVEVIAAVPEQDLVLASTVVKCTQHNKTMEYFCENCKVSTCIDCYLSKVHRGHDMVLMGEIVEEEFTSLKHLLRDTGAKWDIYNEYINDVEKFMKTVAEKKDASYLVIRELFEKLKAELQRVEEDNLKWLDEPYEKCMDELQRAKNAFAKAKGKLKYVAELADKPLNGSGENIIKAKYWLADVSSHIEAVLLKTDVEEGNEFSIDRALITSRDVSGVKDDGQLAVINVLDGLKNISFQRNISHYDGPRAGTF